MIIAEMPYETADPTVDSQIVALKASGADIFVNITTPKFAAQAIKKVGRARLEAGAHPQQRVGLDRLGAASRPGSRTPRASSRPPIRRTRPIPAWRGDPGLKNWTAFMDKYFPEGDKTDSGNVTAYITAKALVQVLKQCGDNLTRENVMRQAANLKDVELDMLIARHQGEYKSHRLFPAGGAADAALQRGGLGIVRPDHERGNRKLKR